MKLGRLKVAAMAVAAGLMAGCAGVNVHKGAVIDNELVATLQPGVDNKASVEKLLGRPSFTGQFSPNDWYYVSRDTNQFAFRNPRVREQTIYRVSFDPAGNVVAVQTSGKDMIAHLQPSRRMTPTLGRKRSFFDEIFGNIGSVGAGGPAAPQGY